MLWRVLYGTMVSVLVQAYIHTYVRMNVYNQSMCMQAPTAVKHLNFECLRELCVFFATMVEPTALCMPHEHGRAD